MEEVINGSKPGMPAPSYDALRTVGHLRGICFNADYLGQNPKDRIKITIPDEAQRRLSNLFELAKRVENPAEINQNRQTSLLGKGGSGPGGVFFNVADAMTNLGENAIRKT